MGAAVLWAQEGSRRAADPRGLELDQHLVGAGLRDGEVGAKGVWHAVRLSEDGSVLYARYEVGGHLWQAALENVLGVRGEERR